MLSTYDVRGIYGISLTEIEAYLFGYGIVFDRLHQTCTPAYETIPTSIRVIIGYDCRHSSPTLAQALSQGARDAGATVISCGPATTPLLHYISHKKHCDLSNTPSPICIMVTASHNPAEWNGIKAFIDSRCLDGQIILSTIDRYRSILSQSQVVARLTAGPVASSKKPLQPGSEQDTLRYSQYSAYCLSQLSTESLHQAGSDWRILWHLGQSAVQATLDSILPSLPGHHVVVPGSGWDFDPTTSAAQASLLANLAQHSCQLGFSFDGDGDRIVAAIGDGSASHRSASVIPSDVLALYLLQNLQKQTNHRPDMDLKTPHPAARASTILYDISTSQYVIDQISTLYPNLQQRFSPNGHNIIKEMLRHDERQLMAFESSGHIYMRYDTGDGDHLAYDDGLAVALRIVNAALSADSGLSGLAQLQSLLAEWQQATTAIKRKSRNIQLSRPISHEERGEFISRMAERINAKWQIQYLTAEALRCLIPGAGWWSMRFANTESVLRVTAEYNCLQTAAQIWDLCSTLCRESDFVAEVQPGFFANDLDFCP